MSMSLKNLASLFIFSGLLVCSSTAFSNQITSTTKTEKSTAQLGKFTGRVLGNHVRMRNSPDLDSHVVKELNKGDLLIILGEKEDFYIAEPTNDIKAYIFRSFVLDNVVEGNRVNVRIAPDLEAPIINHLSTGKRIDGKICDKNNKWLEIAPPEGTKFYVAKEYIEHAGGPELKGQMDKRKAMVSQLYESACLLSQAEMRKPFEEIGRDRIIKSYQTIVDEYKDFPEFIAKAKEALISFNEGYLERKISYLEAKASKAASSTMKEETITFSDHEEINIQVDSLTDRMKIWEPIEESIYLSWAAMHRAKTMDDFYVDQRLKSITISGILDAYIDPVKNKPGDFILKEKDIPIAYVYSTHVNLQSLIGKRVNLIASPRPNNSFAFPAYYVLDAE